MNNIFKKSFVILSAATLTSSINVNPNLIYDWNNCLNSNLYIVAPQWDVIDSFTSSNADEFCVVVVTVRLYDYVTFLKIVKTEGEVETTTYYSTNIFGYRISETKIINNETSSETTSTDISSEESSISASDF